MTANGPLPDNAFRKGLAMFLMAAERHSRFGYQHGYVCKSTSSHSRINHAPDRGFERLLAIPGSPPHGPVSPGVPANQLWTDTSCTWLWHEDLFDKRLGPPLSWASWDGGFKFERQFEFLNVSLDCSTGETGFSWA